MSGQQLALGEVTLTSNNLTYIIIAAVISWFLIEDAVVERALEPEGEEITRPGDVDFAPTAAD